MFRDRLASSLGLAQEDAARMLIRAMFDDQEMDAETAFHFLVALAGGETGTVQ